VSGRVQRPGDASPTGRRTQLFINDRPFRDPFLVRAAEAGYRSAIHPGDRPSLFLRLETAPDEVDVNVHPAKLEVRFRDRIGVERAVEEAVREALGKVLAAAVAWSGLAGEAGGAGIAGGADRDQEDSELFLSGTQQDSASSAPPASSATSALIQVFNTYILYSVPEGLVFVDQHSAHERVLYEEVMARVRTGGLPSQRLLLPLTLELTDEELEAVETHGEAISRVGYEVEPFGGRTVVIHAVPAPHQRFDAERCFREMIADLARGRFGGWANQLERFSATYACRAAIKGGESLTEPEMRALMTRLLSCDLPPHDVHGRATMVRLPLEELERRFGRR
jgi:DNA mismatch repair protein MutL